jgi:FAD synthetase
MSRSPKIIMVFGSFDHLHQGHIYFLRKAKKLGEKLVVVVARDQAVLEIKGKAPNHSVKERIKNIEKENIASEVVSGDKLQSSWKIFKKYKPAVIALGYDQKKLRDSLNKVLPELGLKCKIVTISPYHPEKYQSRFIKNHRSSVKFSGIIEAGKKEAGALGFPTINIPLNIEYPSGIYGGLVHLHGVDYKSAIYIRPKGDLIEAHILNFDRYDELYGEWVVIEIGRKIRESVKTKSIEKMKKLIAKDVETIRNLDSVF